MISWDEYYMNIAFEVAKKSKDPSTKVGAVLVGTDDVIVSTGFNGFPRGLRDAEEDYQDRQKKYAHIVHAELNAILFADGRGRGGRLYTTLFPCNECAKAIIQAGVKEVVVPEGTVNVRFAESMKTSKAMLRECRVLLRAFECFDPIETI